MYLYFNLQLDSETEEATKFTGMLVAVSQNYQLVDLYFDDGTHIKSTKELFQQNVGDIDTVELPVTLEVEHAAGSARSMCIAFAT